MPFAPVDEQLELICRGAVDIEVREELRKKLEKSAFVKKHKARLISAVTHDGVTDLVEALWVYVERFRAANLA